MKKIYIVLLLVFSISKTFSQCGAIIGQALIHAYNDGIAEEGSNEFIVFTTIASATAGSYTLYYGSNAAPYSVHTADLSGLDATTKTSTGSFSGCTFTEVTSSNTMIPANSTVIFVPADLHDTYNISPLCTAGSNSIYVVYIDRSGSHSTWANGGQMANSGGARYLGINDCAANVVSYNAGSAYSTAGDGVSWNCGTAVTYKNSGTNTSTWTFPSPDPPATLDLASASATATQTICSNSAIDNIIYNIGGAATGAVVTGLPSGVSGNFNAGVFTISGTATAFGTFNYTITATGPSCTDPSLTGTIIADSLPNIIINASGPTIFCAGGSVTLTAPASTGNSNYTYLWMPGGQTDPSITVSTPGNYTLTVTNGNGCTKNTAQNVTVENTVPVAQIISLNGCTSIAYNGSVYISSTTIKDTLKNAGGCDSVYQTVVITITPAIAASQNIALSGCKSYTYNNKTYTSPVTLKDTLKTIGGCDSVYRIIDITIEPDPNILLQASANPVNSGTAVTITTTSAPALPYTVSAWEPKNIFASQNALSQTFAADTTTQINVIATSAEGCIDTAKLVLIVNSAANDFFVPNAFSPNGGGHNEFFKAEGSAIKTAQMNVFNQWGQLIFQGSAIAPGWDGIYNGKPQPVGVYVYVISATMNDGKVITAKGSFNLIR